MSFSDVAQCYISRFVHNGSVALLGKPIIGADGWDMARGVLKSRLRSFRVVVFLLADCEAQGGGIY